MQIMAIDQARPGSDMTVLSMMRGERVAAVANAATE